MRTISLKESQEIQLKMFSHISTICKRHNIKIYARAGTLLGAVRHNGFIPWDDDMDLEVYISEYFSLLEILKAELNNNYEVFDYSSKRQPTMIIRVGLSNGNHDNLHIDIFPIIGLSDNFQINKRIINRFKFSNYYMIIRRTSFKDVFRKKKIKAFFILPIKIMSLVVPKRIVTAYIYGRLSCKFPIERSRYIVNPFSKYGTKSIFEKAFYEKIIPLKFENTVVNVPYRFDEILIQLYGDYMCLPSIKDRLPFKKIQIYELEKEKK